MQLKSNNNSVFFILLYQYISDLKFSLIFVDVPVA